MHDVLYEKGRRGQELHQIGSGENQGCAFRLRHDCMDRAKPESECPALTETPLPSPDRAALGSEVIY